jgi:excisionase family DNA binding protein
MGKEDYGPPVAGLLDALADLLTEKYFERVEERLKKIPELRRLITAKEASQYLSVSTDTIYHMAATKKIPYIKIGGRVLFDLKALDRWIDRHLVQEKGEKRQEIKPPGEREKPAPKREQEADLLSMLKK